MTEFYIRDISGERHQSDLLNQYLKHQMRPCVWLDTVIKTIKNPTDGSIVGYVCLQKSDDININSMRPWITPAEACDNFDKAFYGVQE